LTLALGVALALSFLYQVGGLLFFTVLEWPHAGLLLVGPLCIVLPLVVITRRTPRLAPLLLWRPAPVGSHVLGGIIAATALPAVLAITALVVESPAEIERYYRSILHVDSYTGLAVVLVGAALAPAISEELLFRGWLQSTLERRLGRWPGILLAAVWFGLIHGPERALGAFLMGAGFGWLTSRCGSIGPAIAGHATVNGIAVLLLNSGYQVETAATSAAEAFRIVLISSPIAAVLLLVFGHRHR
jgi:membrane protease YdiL (CAAX protease family)